MTVNDVTKVKMKCFVKKVGKLWSQTLAIDGQTESESDALGPKMATFWPSRCSQSYEN
jgi:hypothetical protein